MTELLKKTGDTWNAYLGESHYWLLFFVALVYLLIFQRKRAYFRYLAGYLTVTLAVYWCPITEKFVIHFIGDTFWRLLWLVPVFPVIALAFTELLFSIRSKWLKGLCLLLLVGLIGIVGKDYWTQEYFFSYGNRQKVPDAVAYICETIKADAGGEEVTAAVDNRYAPYIRVYDASIRMPFGRNMRGALTKSAKRLYKAMSAEVPDGKIVGKYAVKTDCTYLVVRIYDEKGLKRFQRRGYVPIGETGVYKILKREDT